MWWIADIASWILLIAGSILVLVTGVALLRLPDYLSRVHGASVGDTAGAGLILSGLCLQSGVSLVSVKLVLVIVFLVLTGPVAAYALAKASVTFDRRSSTGEEGGP